LPQGLLGLLGLLPAMLPGVLAVFALPAAAGAVELSLAAAVDLALQRNPALLAVEERRREVQGGIEEARADAWPQLAAVSAWSRSRNPSLLNSPDFGEILDAFPEGDFTPQVQELNTLGVEVSQPLFTFGKIGAAVSLARTVAEVTDAQIAAARLDTALAAAEAYFEVLASERALVTVEEQERARRASLAVIQARYDLGEATRLELLQSQATLAELLPALATSEGRLDEARARLRRALGLEPGVPLELAQIDDRRIEVVFGDIPAPETLMAVAVARRPELADLELQAEALGSQQQVTRADGRPQIELNGLYGREARRVGNLDDALFANWRVAVGMRWEFFDGRRRKGQIAQLESRRRQLELERQNLLQGIRLEIETRLTELRTARARLEAAEVASTAAREAARVAEDSYGEGVALQADLLGAQQRETEAEIRRVEARYQTQVSAARLLRSLGYLPTEDWREGVAEVAE
jgi:HAE1 family hydrophobic/amphiphilic exporter-1